MSAQKIDRQSFKILKSQDKPLFIEFYKKQKSNEPRQELVDLFDIKVYVFTPYEKIRERWFERAISRGKSGSAAEVQFEDVNSTAQIYIRPTMKNADIVINGLASAEYIEEITTRIVTLINDVINFYR